jgi:hypothetical protein
MHFHVSTDLESLAQYLGEFMALVDQKRWFKRADQLASEINRSMHLQKIVADYHWLEMHISHQWEMLQHERKLNVTYLDPLVLAALKFAATTVEVHRRLGTGAKVALEGSLVNALKAETGFASLYLELSLGQSLIDSGFDVHFADMEGTARYDLLYSRDGFAAEVECKSQSADAGRQIHRKDFYRFLAATEPILSGKTQRPLKEAFIVTLASRLPSSNPEQKHLLGAISSLANDDSLKELRGKGFHILRRPLEEIVVDSSLSVRVHEQLKAAYGQNVHASGVFSEQGGTLIVMHSEKEDDPSAPTLEAMRKAASQFTGTRPAFIAVQDHGIDAADLMLPHLRRRMGVLSYALFGHYGATHVAATRVSGFGAVVSHDGNVVSPAFSVPNPEPKFPVSVDDGVVFLGGLSDQDYADMIGAPLPASNISYLPFD